MSAVARGWRQLRSVSVTRLALAAGVALSLLLIHATTRSRTAAGGTSSLSLALTRSTGCNSPLIISERNSANWWHAALSSDRLQLEIGPRNATELYNCPDLSLAQFSVHLHYSHGHSHRVDASALVQPNSMGSYTFPLDALPPPIILDSQTIDEPLSAELQVTLEFGFLPGGGSGQPCLGATCNAGELSRMGVEWSGQEVLTSEGKRVTIQVEPQGTVGLSSAEVPLCPSLNPLPAVYLPSTSSHLFTAPTGDPCILLSPSAHVTSPNAPLIWIHLVGDSNLRHLIPHLSRALGLKHCVSHTRAPEPYPTSWVCHDGSGGGVVLTFSWWFLTTDQDDARNLGSIPLTSLSTFLTSIPFPTPHPTFPSTFLSPSPPKAPTHLFISLGSHAPLLTATGLHSALSHLTPAFLSKLASARTTSYLSTTAVNPRAIPSSYGPQSVMRNNVMLARTNALLATYVEGELAAGVEGHVVEYVDLFSWTAGLWPFVEQEMVDSVHFKEGREGEGEGVYDVWARVLWTAVERGRARESGMVVDLEEERRAWEEQQEELGEERRR